jgi:signal transduction histidine kinase
LQPRVVNLNELLTGLGKMLSRLIGEDIRLEFQLLPELGSIMADPGQIEQVVMNLVVNARDAMPAGGAIKLETATEEFSTARVLNEGELPAGSYLRTSVHDSGAGIAPDVLPKIFDPFFTTKGDEGTGLGLATVYSIVHRARGDIAVHSELGRGTRFDVYLPLTSGPKDRAA